MYLFSIVLRLVLHFTSCYFTQQSFVFLNMEFMYGCQEEHDVGLCILLTMLLHGILTYASQLIKHVACIIQCTYSNNFEKQMGMSSSCVAKLFY